VGFISMPMFEVAWAIGMIGLFVFTIGTAVFAVFTYRMGALARPAAALLATGAAVQACGFVILFVVDWNSSAQSVMFFGMALFSLGWILLGTDAVRRDRLPFGGTPTTA
jgi:hypothetical protein